MKTVLTKNSLERLYLNPILQAICHTDQQDKPQHHLSIISHLRIFWQYIIKDIFNSKQVHEWQIINYTL